MGIHTPVHPHQCAGGVIISDQEELTAFMTLVRLHELRGT